MKKMMFLVALMFATFTAFAQPFGLRMGMTVQDFNRMGVKLVPHPKTAHVYKTQSLPDGHHRIQEYQMVITPQQGLCRIAAFTPDIKTGPYGTELRTEYKTFQDALTARYKAGREYDNLRRGSNLEEPHQFMLGLVRKERDLSTYWLDEKTPLPGTLEAVSVEARGLDLNTGDVQIVYEYKNFTACQAVLRSQSSNTL